MTLAIALAVVMLVSTAICWRQFLDERTRDERERRIEKLAPLSDEWRMPR